MVDCDHPSKSEIVPPMKTSKLVLNTLCFIPLLLALTCSAVAFEFAKSPLMTPWAEDIEGESPLPEYPRPMMVRSQWMNLNGVWEFEACEKGTPLPEVALSREILVPFPWQSALSGIREHFDAKRAWYRRTFDIPEQWKGQRLMLQFGAVDWHCEVYVNGHYVGSHTGGYDAFEIEITEAVSFDTENTLAVQVFDPGTDAGVTVGKQADRRFEDSGRYTYSPISGIWQTVWIEPVPQDRIVSLKSTPDIDNEWLHLVVHADVYSDVQRVEAIVLSEGKTISRAEGQLSKPFVVDVKSPKLWWPDDPFLYDLELILKDAGGKELDRVHSYFGMRKIEIRDQYINNEKNRLMGPVKKILLNNTFVFQMGPLDQGYWPDGLYTAPTDEALKWDVEQTRNWGYNMTRKHIKVEPQRWYYWCDKLGLLVWQDMPSTFLTRTDAEKEIFETELSRMVRTHWNHPSIVNWVVFNEHWGVYDVKRLTEWVMELDPSRLVTGNSGIDAGIPDLDYEVGHIKDNHHYRPPTNPYPSNRRAVVNGEYGAIGYLVDGHIWNPNEDEGDWVHYNYAGKEAATEEYLKFVEQLQVFKDRDALSGAVYTQWTDLESEMNGLYTYDRKVEKLDMEQVRDANRSLWSNDRKTVGNQAASERLKDAEIDGGPDQID